MKDKIYISFKVDEVVSIPSNVYGMMIEDINNLAREYHVDSDNAHFQFEQNKLSLIHHGTINAVVSAQNYSDAAIKIVKINSSKLVNIPKRTFVTFECLDSSEVYGCIVERDVVGLRVKESLKFKGTPHDIFHAEKSPQFYLSKSRKLGGSDSILEIPVPRWKSKYQ